MDSRKQQGGRSTVAGPPAPELRAVVKCIRCGAWLIDPESVARGIGPRCGARE